MSEKANYFKLGLFVIAAVTTGIVLLIAFGAARFLTSSYVLETYFNESVQGLDVGSKVRYRGVVVGDVRKITFSYTRYELDKPPEQRKRYVLVEASVRPELVGAALFDQQRLEAEIARGLRVRLAAQGITGQMYLEIDYLDPVANPELAMSWTPANYYIPSAQSQVRQFVDAVEALLDRLQKFDLEGTIGNMNKLMQTMTGQIEKFNVDQFSKRANSILEKMDKAQLDKVGEEAAQLIAELRRSNTQLQTTLANPAWQKFPDDAAAAAKQARQILEAPELQNSITRLQRTTKRLDQLFGARDADIATSLDNLRQITDNLRDLSENVKRNPGSLLFSQPPQPAESRPR